MVPQRCHERRIDRPSGIPGYRPNWWCSVCGKKALPRTDRKCVVAHCQNYCHSSCLGDEVDYNCEKTAGLRALQGITDAIRFFAEGDEVAPPTPETSNDEEHLEDLPKNVLVDLVRNLRRDLATAKSQLNTFKNIVTGLPERRSVIVEVLEVIDTLVATQANTEELHQRSIACTARSNKIDEEWEKQLEESDETYIWWADQKTKKIKPKHAPTKPSTNLENSQPHQGQHKQRQEHRHQPLDRHLSSRENQEGGQQGGQKQKRRSFHNHPHKGNLVTATRCAVCHRQGHSGNDCPRHKVCEYCKGRYHTAQSCRHRLADQRQQELIQAVKQTTQESYTAAQRAQWHHPNIANQQFLIPQHTAYPTLPNQVLYRPYPMPYNYGVHQTQQILPQPQILS